MLVKSEKIKNDLIACSTIPGHSYPEAQISGDAPTAGGCTLVLATSTVSRKEGEVSSLCDYGGGAHLPRPAWEESFKIAGLSASARNVC